MLLEIGLAIGGLIIVVKITKVTSRFHKRRQRKKALNGDYGEEVRWATELVEEDMMFRVAVNHLPSIQIKELGIIAESKEELREITIERLDELSNGDLPEDFA